MAKRAQSIDQLGRDWGYALTGVYALAYRLDAVYAGHDEASRTARRIVKRFFPDLGTYTLDHDDGGWNVTIYSDTERARQFGLLR